MYAVIIEWQDGTVTTNGPYDDQETAIRAARILGERIAEDQGQRTVGFPEIVDGARVGPVDFDADDWDEFVDIYAREMGHPIDVGSSGVQTGPPLKATVGEPVDLAPSRQTEPQFKVGDRVFTHYDMKWGTIERVGNTDLDRTHGVTGSKMDDTTWYEVRYDNGRSALLDDAHGNWDMARIVPPHIAKRYGYGTDPKASN